MPQVSNMGDATFWFPVVKVLHIGALVLWLGPSGGAWLVLMTERRKSGEPNIVSHHLYAGFLRMLWFQHLGILLMVGSGLMLLAMYGPGLLESTWLRWKLSLIVAVIIPIELSDMWFSHRLLPGVFAKRQPDAPYTQSERRRLNLYHRRFTPIVLPLLLAVVVAIMWLAVAKPA